jgi:uncharacterized protein involved in tellurium resistance
MSRAEIMKYMDTQDIGYTLFCHPDFAMARAMNQNFDLERIKTLMQGDDFCDHKYKWEV